MLYTEPRVAAARIRLGFFEDFEQQERADLEYGHQGERLKILVRKPPEWRPEGTIPVPPTPPSR